MDVASYVYKTISENWREDQSDKFANVADTVKITVSEAIVGNDFEAVYNNINSELLSTVLRISATGASIEHLRVQDFSVKAKNLHFEEKIVDEYIVNYKDVEFFSDMEIITPLVSSRGWYTADTALEGLSITVGDNSIKEKVILTSREVSTDSRVAVEEYLLSIGKSLDDRYSLIE